MLTETFNQSINNEQVIISLETLDGSGTSKHADSNPETFDRSESSTSSERLIDITFGREREDPEVSGSDNSDYPVTHINGTNSMLVPAETSSSSSSSESSSNDFFQARKVRFAESAVSKSASEDEQSDVSRESSVKSEAGQRAPTSPSQVYNSTHGHMGMSPTISPPVQVMDRSSEHDRHRIPSSVFASKTNSMDWSNASNESLFSIQIGNTSLTRDRAFLSPDICKSGELTKSGELNMFHPLPSVLIGDRDTGRKNIEMEDSQTTEMSDEDLKLEDRLSEKNSHPADSYELSNVPCLPNGNGNGSHSSASPIKKKCTWRLCYCNNCSWAFCYYKLPSCYLRCPRCCLTCPSCWCCCRASAVLTDEERFGSVKIQQQSSNKSSEVTSSSTCNFCNWCQCFSWSCYTCCSQRDSPRQQSYDKASEKTSSSTSNSCTCSWGKCCGCASCCCCCCCLLKD